MSHACGAARTVLHVVAYDFGIKRNILRLLAGHDCRVTVVPAQTPAADVLALKPDGVFLSNGPGDPAAVTYAIETTRALLGSVPIFGICLGHQILGLALGGETYKLKFGHRGGNQPVRHEPTHAVAISSHNHGFAVHAESLPPEVDDHPRQPERRLRRGPAPRPACAPSRSSTTRKPRPARTMRWGLFDEFIALMLHAQTH